jgi:hypothetical protein
LASPPISSGGLPRTTATPEAGRRGPRSSDGSRTPGETRPDGKRGLHSPTMSPIPGWSRVDAGPVAGSRREPAQPADPSSMPHLPPLACDPSARGRKRHPHRTGAPGSSRPQGHDDLSPCARSRAGGSALPGGPVAGGLIGTPSMRPPASTTRRRRDSSDLWNAAAGCDTSRAANRLVVRRLRPFRAARPAASCRPGPLRSRRYTGLRNTS